MFTFQVFKNRIAMTESEELTAGSANVYQTSWQFSTDWTGLTKKIAFTVDTELSTIALPVMYLYLDDNGMCQIPREVLSPTWVGKQILAGACGTRGTETVLPTVWVNLGTLKEAAAGDPGVPSITPTEYDALKEDIGDLDDLTTEDKTSLVNALNEVNAKIGEGGDGNVKSEQIENIVALDRGEYDDLDVKDSKTLYLIKG